MVNWVAAPAGKDSSQNDICRKPGLSVEQLKQEAERLGAEAFNTDGWIKNYVKPTHQWDSVKGSVMYLREEVFERAKKQGLAAISSQGTKVAQQWTAGSYMVTLYWSDIPDGYRLCSYDEFGPDANQALRKRDPGGWSIAMLSDGKCDGHGYNPPHGGRHKMTIDQIQDHTMYTMGDMMLVKDDAGSACENWADAVLDKLQNGDDQADTFTAYTREYYEHKGGVLVCSCPGDQHGGMHSRVKRFTESHGWDYAPVQFDNWSREAAEWFKYWKINVERCLTHSIRAGKRHLLEVKVNGGGAGCEQERSKNMTHWWIDCIKRMGRHLYKEMQSNGKNPVSVGGDCQVLLVGQVVMNEDDYNSFTREGAELKTVRGPDGTDMAIHYLILNGAKNWWTVATIKYAKSGGTWEPIDGDVQSGGY